MRVLFFIITMIIFPAFAEEIYESPNLRAVMEFVFSREPYSNFTTGEVIEVIGYIEENHGLTKVGNTSLDVFLELPDGTKNLVLEKRMADENGNFRFSVPLITDYPFGRYLLSVEPYGLGYQRQLENDKHILEFFLVEVIDRFPPPIKQIKSGILVEEIKCNENLVKIIKKNGNPACVTPETKSKLIKRGWALEKDD